MITDTTNQTDSSNWWDTATDPTTTDPTGGTMSDPQPTAAPGQTAGSDFDTYSPYITSLYQKYLGRDPESQDVINNWINGTAGQTDENRRFNLENMILETPEAQAYAKSKTTTPATTTTTTTPPADQPTSPALIAPPPLSTGSITSTGGLGSGSTGVQPASSGQLDSIFAKMNAAASGSSIGGGPPANISGDLYSELLARAKQGENVDANDPNIKQQVDPYSAQVERERRDYLDQVAEQRGPMGNIDGERRLSAERAGQATGLFQSQLIGRELQSKRDEIQQALSQLGNQMSTDQQQALSKEMNYLNNSLQKYGIDTGANTSLTGIFTNAGLDQQRINSNNDQFAQTFGLNSENQANYWDAIRRGLIK